MVAVAYSTGSPSLKYEHRRASALLRNIQNIMVLIFRAWATCTYGRWSFTRGSNCKALTERILVFWIGGRLWEVVASERWLPMEVRLYFI